MEDDEPQLTLEETLDLERAKIISGTPVTQQSFIEWKRRKEERKKKEAEEQKVARDKELKQGKTQMSGRELFEYQPDLFVVCCVVCVCMCLTVSRMMRKA